MFAKTKRSVWVGIIAGLLVLAGVLFIQTTGVKAQEVPKKVWVCKYVGTPNVDERLQTGNNPISVSTNSIQHNQWNGAVPGWFSDAHNRSYVISYDTSGNGGGQEGEPTISDCPTPTQPTIALAGVNITPATCKVGETLVYGEVKNATVKAGSTADKTVGPANYNVTFVANEGAAFETSDEGMADELSLSGQLKGALTDPSCETGDVLGGTTSTPAAATPTQLPRTNGEAAIVAIFGVGTLAASLGFAVYRRLAERNL